MQARPGSAEKDLVVVALEVLPARAVLRPARQPEFRPLELVVRLPVVELVLEVGAHAEAVVRGDRDVSAVEEPVEVGAEEEPVGDLVPAAGGVGDDMGGLEGGERRAGGSAGTPTVSGSERSRAILPPHQAPPDGSGGAGSATASAGASAAADRCRATSTLYFLST